jgi:hypothetical protein
MATIMPKILLLGAGSLARDIIVIAQNTAMPIGGLPKGDPLAEDAPDYLRSAQFTMAYVDAAYRGSEPDCEGVRICTNWDEAVALSTHFVLGIDARID